MYFSSSDIHWVAISNNLKKQALQSSILKNKTIQVIYSGIDCDKYTMIEKSTARKKLNLPLMAKIILIGAGNLQDKEKGFEYVINILNNIDRNILVVTFGSGTIDSNEIPQRVINKGFLYKLHELVHLYSCADVFFAPSVSEAFGKTLAESQACGTPIVCFSKTGPSDIVEHKKTGYLASFKSEKDLLNGVLYSLNQKFDRNYIRNRAKSLFDIKLIAKQYFHLYEKLSKGS